MADDPVIPSWEERYRNQRVEEMPWYYAEIDPDVAKALDAHGVSGRALDVGTGPATQAIALAQRGFEVIGTDISPSAVEQAEQRARAAGVSVVFRQDDILDSKLTETFDLILDRGCFHVMTPQQRPVYLSAIAARLVQGGLLFLKCFSDEQPGTDGPKRFSPQQIEEIFGARFDLLSLERTIYQGTLDPMPKALFAVLRRK